MSSNYIINSLINALQKLPTIGQRTAKRMALNMLQNKDTTIKPLIEAMNEAYNKIHKCKICGNYTSNEICSICSDTKRDIQTICIVESISDLWAIENINIYNGIYHILDGTLSAIEGRGE